MSSYTLNKDASLSARLVIPLALFATANVNKFRVDKRG
jgi:hypothetical protein